MNQKHELGLRTAYKHFRAADAAISSVYWHYLGAIPQNQSNLGVGGLASFTTKDWKTMDLIRVRKEGETAVVNVHGSPVPLAKGLRISTTVRSKDDDEVIYAAVTPEGAAILNEEKFSTHSIRWPLLLRYGSARDDAIRDIAQSANSGIEVAKLVVTGANKVVGNPYLTHQLEIAQFNLQQLMGGEIPLKPGVESILV